MAKNSTFWLEKIILGTVNIFAKYIFVGQEYGNHRENILFSNTTVKFDLKFHFSHGKILT